MSQEVKDQLLAHKNYFNSKVTTPLRTSTGSSRKEKKVMIKHQYEDEYKDLASHNSNDIWNEAKPKNKNCSGDTHDFKTKWKTEKCHYWEVNGVCKYRDNCAFAHGENELRNRKMSISYKTKQCKRFFEMGYCAYGSRCQFSHKEREKKQMSYLMLLSNFTLNGNSDAKLPKRPRLKTFEHLSLFNEPNEERTLAKEEEADYKRIESNDHCNSIDTKDNDKEDNNNEQRGRYLSV